LSRKNRLFKNVVVQSFVSLSFIQLVNLIVPFLTYPYIISIIGLEKYGLLLVPQGIAAFFNIISDYGYKLLMTKEISINRNDNHKLQDTISKAITFKVLIGLIIMLTWFIIIRITPYLWEFKELHIASFGLIIYELLFPTYFYQGVEKMYLSTVQTIVGKVVTVCLIFIFLNNPKDFILIPIFQSIGFSICVILAYVTLYRKFNLKIKFLKINFINELKKTSYLVLSNLITTSKDKLSYIIIGSQLGPSKLAIIDFGLKLSGLISQPADALQTALYPNLITNKNIKKGFRYTNQFFPVLLLIVLLTQIGLNKIIILISNEFIVGEDQIRILLLSPIVMIYSLFFVRHVIIANGLKRILINSSIATAIFYFSTTMLLIKSENYSIQTVSILTISCLIFELILRIHLSKSFKQIKRLWY